MQQYNLTFISQYDIEEPATMVVSAASRENALDWFFFNQQDERKPFPHLCSMCAGDVVEIGGSYWLCRSVGWAEITTQQFERWKKMDRRDLALGQMP